MKYIALLGLGWLGLPLAKKLHQEGYKVWGSVSSLNKLYRYGDLPFGVSRVHLAEDKIKGDWEALLHKANILIITIPPKRVEGIEVFYPRLISQITARSSADLKVIFTSTTGVYANKGRLVNESITPNPDKPSGKAVFHAEQILAGHFKSNLTILRLAGLIGEDRHPGRFLADKKALGNGEVPVNLVHQEDCIGIIQEVIRKDCWGETINVCAGKHPVRKEYYQKASKVLGLPPPLFKRADASDYKIIDNSYGKALLNYQYKYDDPQEIFKAKDLGKISIVGAGPGDVELLTLKAINAIKEADVLLHDNLISEEILRINPYAKLIYVGKKYGDSSDQTQRQHKINELLLEHYRQGKKVIRLKSGDPYIYGRAAEEARFLTDHKVPFDGVPGISAALAAATLNNIPITERHRSNALLICTAHTADYSDEQLNGVGALLKSGNTLAIYMGLKSLDKLIPKLIKATCHQTIPILAISNVSRSNEVILRSKLACVQDDVKKAGLPMPVVFLVGAETIGT